MPLPNKRLLNLALRGSTLVSKFALVFMLAKFLEPADVGLYGLLAATIGYVLMGLGFDFYTYSTRELINTSQAQWAAMLRDQAVFYVITYGVLMPLCLLVFWYEFLPWHLAVWFFLLLALEHVAQELNRLLVAMSQPLWASIVLFVRSGSWSIVAVVWLWANAQQRNLDLVLACWAVGVCLACVLGLWRLQGIGSASLAQPINWAWVRKGIRVALPFVVATLCLRALYTVDRYWLEALGGLEVLAAYVLFVGIANAVLSFLDAAVFTFAYPALVASAGKGDATTFNLQMRKLWQHTAGVCAALAVLALLCAGPVVNWLNRPSYGQHFSMLYWAMLAAVLSAISMVPHYGLYARRHDKPIFISHILSVPVFIMATLMLLPVLSSNAVPAGMAVSFLFLLCVKQVAYQRAGPLRTPANPPVSV